MSEDRLKKERNREKRGRKQQEGGKGKERERQGEDKENKEKTIETSSPLSSPQDSLRRCVERKFLAESPYPHIPTTKPNLNPKASLN